jgi:aerobic carbon-monoxide dehydrogenase small subunit
VSADSLSYTLHVNGTECSVEHAWIGESLLYVLRERLNLAGAKNACEQGECGSCSVKVDGDLVCSCLVLAAGASGCAIETIEGIAATDPYTVDPFSETALSSVQQSFIAEGAVQCGFCTPGLIMAIHDLLDRTPTPDNLEIREAISGNLCRCTGYGRIFEAVESAVAARAAIGSAAGSATGSTHTEGDAR